MVGIIKNDKGTFYWRKAGLEKNGIASIKKWVLPGEKRKKIEKIYYSYVKQLNGIVKKINAVSFSASKNNEIKNLALEWHRLYYQFWCLTDVFEVANYGAPVLLKSALAKLVPADKVETLLEILLAPEKLSFNQLSQKELLECKLKAKTSAHLDKLLEDYAKKWFWLNNSYFGSKDLNKKYFYNRIRKLSLKKIKDEYKEIVSYPSKIKKQKSKISKEYKIPSQTRKLAHALSSSIWLQDHRKGMAWRSSSVITILSKHLANRLEVPLPDILHYSADEWAKAFDTDKKVAEKTIAQRKKFYVFYSKLGFYTFYTGKKATRLAKYFSELYSKSNTANLNGTVVSRKADIVKGRARVLHSALESNKMKAGEILITAMTSPDYIHAMRKAAAIITDVGGLMSHAAVVSRELGIPCIVNTKIATKVFKDGDMVEVDANKGIVRKI
ncbi:MAG: hypothetical protein HY918_02230 [Candidatus Doudnabacteria bacterium]|nr:hypothetical protein [Candidatus Doudnabacteria bacterium]